MSITNNKPARRIKSLCFVGIIAVLPLAVGGVHTSVVLGVLGATLVCWLGGGRRGGPSGHMALPACAVWVFGLACLLQLVPLPMVFHELVNARAAALYREGQALLAPAQAPRTWMPVSLEPLQTADRALRWLALGAWVLVVADVARYKGAWRMTLRAVVGAGIIHFLVGLIQHMAGTEAILFVYEPRVGALDGLTTFVNVNHAAVFYGLVSLAALALCIHSYNRSRAESLISAALAVAFMILMTEHDSQGASLAYWMSVTIMGLALVARARPGHRVGRLLHERFFVLSSLAAMALPAVFAALWWGPRRVQSWIRQSDLGQWITEVALVRLELSRAALEGAMSHPWTGAGAGAVGTALRPFIDWEIVPASSIPTVENEPAEWLFGLGIPVAIVGGLLLLSFFPIVVAHFKRRPRSRLLPIFAIGVYLSVNAYFHFPFFTLGLAVPFVSLLVVGLHSGCHFEGGHDDTYLKYAFVECRLPRWMAVSLVGALVASAVHFGWLYSAGGEDDEARTIETLVDRQRLTPADGSLYVRGAFLALAEGETQRASELIEFGYELDPRLNTAIARATFLARSGQIQLAQEAYRDIFAKRFIQRFDLLHRAQRLMLADLHSPQRRAAALERSHGGHLRHAFDAILRDESVTDAVFFAQELVELRPDSYDAFELLVRGYLLSDQNLLAELTARQFLVSSERDRPDGKTGLVLVLEALIAQKRTDEALELVATNAAALSRDHDFWHRTARMLASVEEMSNERFVEAIETAHHAWCGGPREHVDRSHCWRAEGWLAEREDDLERATWAYERIYRQGGTMGLLLDFHLRHFRCKKISALVREWREENPQENERYRQLHTRMRACQRRMENK